MKGGRSLPKGGLARNAARSSTVRMRRRCHAARARTVRMGKRCNADRARAPPGDRARLSRNR
eukprot:13957975-Alexandrium_andersonii.AAC.1